MRFAPVFALTLLAACGTTEPTADTVIASIDQPSYTRPATVAATITNNSSKTLFTNHCLQFQVRTGDAWVDAALRTACVDVRVEVRAGQQNGAGGAIGVEAAPGEYRGVTHVETDSGDDLVLVTGSFTVQ